MAINILLVDDNRDTLRTYTKAILRKIKPNENSINITEKGFVQIEDADTVTLAFKKLQTQSFDLLVVDLKIPSPSGEPYGGLEIITESLKYDPLRPIIVITGYGSVELARKTLTQGVFDG